MMNFEEMKKRYLNELRVLLPFRESSDIMSNLKMSPVGGYLVNSTVQFIVQIQEEAFERGFNRGIEEKSTSVVKVPLISIENAVTFICDELNITQSYLAGLLNLSTRVLDIWLTDNNLLENSTKKGKRLSRLYEVTRVLKESYTRAPSARLFNLINKLFLFDGDEVSLISILNDNPSDKVWVAAFAKFFDDRELLL